jgi:DNA polymerase V
MGIKMGQPYFQVEGFLHANKVVVCSGNLVMYKEVSDKVMGVLRRFTDTMEAYSIDEAFLRLPRIAAEDAVGYAAQIRESVDRLVGIPISIGIGITKTLAKLASEKAKKTSTGILEITSENIHEILDATEAGDVWGIGPKAAEKLKRYGIVSAGDFIRMDPLWVKQQLTIRGLMTQTELKGQSCIQLVTKTPPPKSIQASRTWGHDLDSFDDVWHAMLENVCKAGRQLREDDLAAGTLSAFIRYGHYGDCGYFSRILSFKEPIQNDVELVEALKILIESIYQQGYKYSQGGVTLGDLLDARYRQRGLFDQEEFEQRAKLERFSRAVDTINMEVGERIVYPATLCVKEKKWRSNRKFLFEKWEGLQNMAVKQNV